jgi:hypothetical protein
LARISRITLFFALGPKAKIPCLPARNASPGRFAMTFIVFAEFGLSQNWQHSYGRRVASGQYIFSTTSPNAEQPSKIEAAYSLLDQGLSLITQELEMIP